MPRRQHLSLYLPPRLSPRTPTVLNSFLHITTKSRLSSHLGVFFKAIYLLYTLATLEIAEFDYICISLLVSSSSYLTHSDVVHTVPLSESFCVSGVCSPVIRIGLLLSLILGCNEMLCLHVIQSYATHVYNQTRYKYNR